MTFVTAAVEAMAEMKAQTPTVPLDEFRMAYEEDDNWWWRIPCGHHQNLFDEALDRIDELTALLQGGGPS